MNNTEALDKNLEAIGWGSIFIWWGFAELIQKLPDGIGLIGIGLTLLALNAVRLFKGIPARSFSILVAVLALVWGVLELANVVLHLPYEIPIFAVLLIVLGSMIIGREVVQMKRA